MISDVENVFVYIFISLIVFAGFKNNFRSSAYFGRV